MFFGLYDVIICEHGITSVVDEISIVFESVAYLKSQSRQLIAKT